MYISSLLLLSESLERGVGMSYSGSCLLLIEVPYSLFFLVRVAIQQQYMTSTVTITDSTVASTCVSNMARPTATSRETESAVASVLLHVTNSIVAVIL